MAHDGPFSVYNDGCGAMCLGVFSDGGFRLRGPMLDPRAFGYGRPVDPARLHRFTGWVHDMRRLADSLNAAFHDGQGAAAVLIRPATSPGTWTVNYAGHRVTTAMSYSSAERAAEAIRHHITEAAAQPA